MREDAQPAYLIYHGLALEGPAFRVVGKCPPTAEDFIPYAMAGRNFPARRFFVPTGVSMFSTREQAARLARLVTHSSARSRGGLGTGTLAPLKAWRPRRGCPS